LAENARAAVSQLEAEVTIEKVSDMGEILSFGVPATPALVIDGTVRVAGRVPDVAEIKGWLAEASDEAPSAESSGSPPDPSGVCCCKGTVEADEEPPCCGPATQVKNWSTEPDDAAWIIGSVDTPSGAVPKVDTTLSLSDRLGGWKARWGIRRMQYWVKPRLYAVGNPTSDSPVFVTANYKMSFDQLRSALGGIDGWILVLDTKGINVWCAAGKGTFGADELIRQIEQTKLSDVVSHRKLVLPQLGAPGVAAHQVRKRSGFRVLYGPVRADDIPAFLQAGMKAAPEMRRVEFPLRDRLAVAPVEIVMSAKYLLAIMVALLVLAGIGPDVFSWARAAGEGVLSAAMFGGAFLASTILTPALLPWLPGRAFSLKGAWIGVFLLLGIAGVYWMSEAVPSGWVILAAWCLWIPVTTSFAAMNFTGSTTYTSLSGVRREMRVAVPIQAAAAILGTVLWLAGRFI
jgi:acetyl-CoA decarbonylase/synthase complex subunit gamma